MAAPKSILEEILIFYFSITDQKPMSSVHTDNRGSGLYKFSWAFAIILFFSFSFMQYIVIQVKVTEIHLTVF